MSSGKIPLKKIIVGTSAWGSKISYSKSFEILEELLDSGFVQFDTAPNYGSGYSQNIINSISKKLIVNTKFGQKMNLSFKEIFKRIYRFNNLNAFFKSNLNLINYSFQNKKKFWLVSNIDKNFIEIKKDLRNCVIDTFFLHSPLKEIISDQFLMEFINFCNLNNVVPGISNIQDDIFLYLISNYRNIVFQMPLTQYLKYEEKIERNQNTIHINSIFRSKYLQNKISVKNYEIAIFEYFKNKHNIKLVLGINSNRSMKSLLNNFNLLN
tara:strand:+ start:2441 stop:3241 length:801 start_codon:yes stop_codon:yes gene_type:complete